MRRCIFGLFDPQEILQSTHQTEDQRIWQQRCIPSPHHSCSNHHNQQKIRIINENVDVVLCDQDQLTSLGKMNDITNISTQSQALQMPKGLI